MTHEDVPATGSWWRPRCIQNRVQDRARRRAKGEDLSKDQSWATWILVCLAERLDKGWKRLDFRSRAATELDPVDWRQSLHGHSPIMLVITLFLMLCMVNGPSLSRGWFPILFTLVAWGLLLLVHRTLGTAGRTDPHPKAKPLSWCLLVGWVALVVSSLWQGVHPVATPLAAVLLGIGGCLLIPKGVGNLAWFGVLLATGSCSWWLLSDETRTAASGQPYRHVLLPLILAVAFFGLVVNPWWAWFLFADRRARYRQVYAKRLHRAQLFDPRIPARAKASDVARAYFVAPVAQPLLLAVVPSILLLLVRRDTVLELLLPFTGGWAEPVFFALAALIYLTWWSIVAMTVFHPRLDGLLSFLRSLFCLGAARAVSVLVIVFAVARLAEVSYVTTILDSSARLITEPLLFLYATAWFYDYWTERSLNDALLGLLHPSEDLPDQVQYSPPNGRIERGCKLLPHGATRWLVLRYTNEGTNHFNFYYPNEVFRRIVTPTKVQSVSRRLFPRLEIQARFYRPLAVVVFVALLFASLQRNLDPQVFPRRFTLAADEEQVDAARTFPWETAAPDEPLLFVAASGGGTRAAIYTQVFLQALWERGAVEHTRLISSVSGGGWANAWYATWREALHQEEPLPAASGATAYAPRRLPPKWQAFRDAVLYAHIDEVLAGAFEWRLLQGQRIGELLGESFRRQLAHADGDASGGPPARPEHGARADLQHVAGRLQPHAPHPQRSLLGRERRRAARLHEPGAARAHGRSLVERSRSAVRHRARSQRRPGRCRRRQRELPAGLLQPAPRPGRRTPRPDATGSWTAERSKTAG